MASCAVPPGSAFVRTTDALLREFERRRREIADLSASAFQTLSILEGAGEALPGHGVAERLLVRCASMTSLLDTLERRGLIERHPNPVDRRKVLIHMTDAGRAIVDQMFPVVHAASTEAFAHLSDSDRAQLIESLSIVRTRLSEISSSPPASPKPRAARGGDVTGSGTCRFRERDVRCRRVVGVYRQPFTT